MKALFLAIARRVGLMCPAADLRVVDAYIAEGGDLFSAN